LVDGAGNDAGFEEESVEEDEVFPYIVQERLVNHEGILLAEVRLGKEEIF
jgi:hypothetical protein